MQLNDRESRPVVQFVSLVLFVGSTPFLLAPALWMNLMAIPLFLAAIGLRMVGGEWKCGGCQAGDKRVQ
jgi:hypothetical protein